MKKTLSFSMIAACILTSCANPNQQASLEKLSLNLVPVSTGVAPESFQAKYYAERREKLFSQISSNSIVILPSHTEITSSADSVYEFVQDRNFYYMTGLNEPDSVAVLVKTDSESKFILFVRPRDPLKEQWNGRRTGLEGAKLIYLADESYDINDFNSVMPQYASETSKLYYDFETHPRYDETVKSWVSNSNTQTLNTSSIDHIIFEMRLIKDEYEKYLIEKGSKISALAHKKTIMAGKNAEHEYELEAAFRYETARYGATKQAYLPIVGAGRNSTILHYEENDSDIQKGDLVLMDAGAEYMNYATDITRTFPASGKFSDEQKAIYELVLKAQLAAIEQIKPGTPYSQLENTVRHVLTEGLVELGILESNGSSIDALVYSFAFRPFYMHSCCHWVGLDVHDVSSYTLSGRSRPLEPGMILTVEPGIYINDTLKNVDSKWLNIGVRIEDTILVTEDGYKVLSKDVPKTIPEIESLMQNN